MTFFDASNLINLKSSMWYLSVQYSLFLFGFVLYVALLVNIDF